MVCKNPPTSRDWAKYIEEQVDNPPEGLSNCNLYIRFGNSCTPCPFQGCTVSGAEGCCGLRGLRSFLRKRADKEVESCDQTDYSLTGTQQDCLKSLLRRIQALEGNDKVQDNFIYQADHQRIACAEGTIRDLQKQVADLKEKLRKV